MVSLHAFAHFIDRAQHLYAAVERVRKTALQIARVLPSAGRQPDLLTVELAALLHDVLDKKYVSEEQASDAYAYFLPFFKSIHESAPSLDLVADGRARSIADIVSNVSWSTEKKLRKEGSWGTWHDECVELHCVQDADRLDAIGAFGWLSLPIYVHWRAH